MAVEDATDLSTAASDQERVDICILCQGSGLLHKGVLSDPCPLCGDQKPSLSGTQTSDDSSCAPASEVDLERAEQSGVEDADQIVKESSQQDQTSTIVKEDGTAITAPPGLGPPGVWIWPSDTAEVAEDTDATKPEADQDLNRMDWPMHPITSAEVEFVGKCAQHCFGADFIKMAITWITPHVYGKISMPAADLQLHLKPTANATFLAPLARLQVILARDQKVYQQHIFRMERSKDDTLMYMTCTKVSMATCWDVLKTGVCPRPHCTWEHPAPTLLNVSCAGQTLPKQHTPLTLPKQHQHTPLATLISRPKADPGSDKIESKDKAACQEQAVSSRSLETPAETLGQLNQIQFNFGAYDTDDSSDEM
jgi:hypothetical protein